MQDLSFKCYWCQHQIDITKNGEYVGLRDYFEGEEVCEYCWILLIIRRHQKDYVEHNWETGENIRVTVSFAEKELEKRRCWNENWNEKKS